MRMYVSVWYLQKTENAFLFERRQNSCACLSGARWRWVWSNGGMILTGENWSTGRKTLYSVGGRWMDEWSNGGMILTGENWSTGRKTLYSVDGRLMDEYGAMVEWYWQGKTEVLGEKHYTAWMVDWWMSMVQWWNGTDRGKLKYWEKNIIQCGW